ncbi:MAG: DUF4962 domain-containing protein [Lachnospiraceae bacterium]|nr:DUF4962 domain-containing protein [Lachnospiraceae bacterium]
MDRLLEPKESLLSVKYRPDGETVYENPPRFCWMPEKDTDEGISYFLEYSGNPEFSDSRRAEDIPYNFYTPEEAFAPGIYYWRYGVTGKEAVSRVRMVIVPEEAAKTPLPGRAVRYRTADMSHPRLWLNQKQIAEFKEALKTDPDYCGFAAFCRDSVETYENASFVKEPLPYPNNKKVISQWRQNYTTCQQALTFIRSLAVGGRIADRKDWMEKAKEGLMELAAWNVEGPTCRDYNDECSFRVAYALAFGYDWLYELLTEEEKEVIRRVLFLRIKQVADHVIIESRIHLSLYDSHAVRSLSSVLTPCCIALLDEEGLGAEKRAIVRGWLDYAIEYFSTIYTPWGGEDGGWAEGVKYWESGMAFVIEAMNTLKSFAGIDFYKRPFFKKTGDFLLYCNPVDTRRASFCDQSNLGKYPGHKAAFNIRQFGGASGNPAYQWYFEQVFKREPEIDMDFFNAGWWDFAFDDMVYRHDYGDTSLTGTPEFDTVKWFRDTGWVAINEKMDDFDNHIFFLTKSSPYGCVSHSHGDQNGILLHAYGEPLLIESGYYIGFRSSMHLDWRRQTRSTNNILIDGQGQYAGMDKVKQLHAVGQVEEVREKDGVVYIRENAAQAYQENVPDVTDVTREIYFVDHSYFVVVDTVEAGHPVSVDFTLHSLASFEISENQFALSMEKAELEGRFVYVSSGMEGITQTDVFEGVNQEEIQGLDRQWHLTMRTGKAGRQVIITLLVPSKKGQEKPVFVMKDDQGQGAGFYFQHDGRTFSIQLDGSRRYERSSHVF